MPADPPFTTVLIEFGIVFLNRGPNGELAELSRLKITIKLT